VRKRQIAKRWGNCMPHLVDEAPEYEVRNELRMMKIEAEVKRGKAKPLGRG
jgi:hypothetical protein